MDAPVIRAIPDGFYCRDDKKNVYLIGDSMKRGTAPFIKRELSDIAEVFFNDCNCGYTQNVIVNLHNWIEKIDDRKKIDLVQFNCGHWDVAHYNHSAEPLTSEAEYVRNLKMIVDQIRCFFPNAKVVFATTCTMNPNGSDDPYGSRSNEIIDRYNKLAVKAMTEYGVLINDMNAIIRTYGSEDYIDYCHLNRDAFDRLGTAAAKNLRAFL